MRWYHVFYMPKRIALQLGFTHEGTMFGIPSWLTEEDRYGQLMTCPKIPVLRYLVTTLEFFCQLMVNTVALMTHDDREITVIVLDAEIKE